MNERELTPEEEERRRALYAEIDGVEAAEQALQNTAVMEYFSQVERQSIDRLLDCDLLDDEMRLKLTIVAQTTRKMRKFLEEKRDLRRFLEAELEALRGADDA